MEYICARLFYIYNLTQEKKYEFDFSKRIDPYELRKSTDYIINHITYSHVPEELKQIWIETKFAYITWCRDEIKLNENIREQNSF